MATLVDLANRALTRAGATRIMSENDDTKSGRAIKATFAGVRDSCLSLANWNFAMTRGTLQATTAQDGFAYAYIIPEEWLRFVEIRDRYVGAPLLGPSYVQDPISEYVIEEGRQLLTNYGPPLKCRGVKRVKDTAQWHPLFCDYFVLSLCAEVWEDVSRKTATKLQVIIDERNKALSVARANNAIMEAPEPVEDTSWVLSRIGP